MSSCHCMVQGGWGVSHLIPVNKRLFPQLEPMNLLKRTQTDWKRTRKNGYRHGTLHGHWTRTWRDTYYMYGVYLNIIYHLLHLMHFVSHNILPITVKEINSRIKVNYNWKNVLDTCCGWIVGGSGKCLFFLGKELTIRFAYPFIHNAWEIDHI